MGTGSESGTTKGLTLIVSPAPSIVLPAKAGIHGGERDGRGNRRDAIS